VILLIAVRALDSICGKWDRLSIRPTTTVLNSVGARAGQLPSEARESPGHFWMGS
jgi:hypothetical protein